MLTLYLASIILNSEYFLSSVAPRLYRFIKSDLYGHHESKSEMVFEANGSEGGGKEERGLREVCSMYNIVT